MRLNFNSKDGVFAIICNLIIDFFDAEIQEEKVTKL